MADIIAITRLILNTNVQPPIIAVDRDGTAALDVQVQQMVVDQTTADLIWRYLDIAKSGGVRVVVETEPAPQSQTFQLGLCTTLSVISPAPNSALYVHSTTGFPSSGWLDVDIGTPTYERVAYSTTAFGTQFNMVIGSPTTQNHSVGACVQLVDMQDDQALPTVAYVASTVAPGAASVHVDTTAGFQVGGALLIDADNPGLAEVVAFAGWDSTHFFIPGTGFTGIQNSHAVGAAIRPTLASLVIPTATIAQGATSITTPTSAGFSASGSFIIDYGNTAAELAFYTGNNGFGFTGVNGTGGTARAHSGSVTIVQANLNTTLSSNITIGAATLTVGSTNNFPTSGRLIIDAASGTPETVSYTAITSTTFEGVVGVTLSHSSGAVIIAGFPPEGGQLVTAQDQEL